VGAWLSEATQRKISQRYQLGKPPAAGNSWQPDGKQSFPRSRRLLALPDHTPGQPFGWVAITFEPVVKPSTRWSEMQSAVQQELTTFQEKRLMDSIQAAPIQPPRAGASPAPIQPPRAGASPASTHIIKSFSKTPAVGDRFNGEIFDTQPGRLLLSIPGLDPDFQAYATVDLPGNRSERDFRDGEGVLCEVRELGREGKVAVVKCRLAGG
jgi:hypothetical protein